MTIQSHMSVTGPGVIGRTIIPRPCRQVSRDMRCRAAKNCSQMPHLALARDGSKPLRTMVAFPGLLGERRGGSEGE